MAYTYTILVVFLYFGQLLLNASATPIGPFDQVVLNAQLPSGEEGEPTYEDGELPPLPDTVGWVDPRLNGGRFLDVRAVSH